ncbi:MAG: enoyl-CoA hydratase/isomerase family protein [Rhodobacteraceae bacterium]|nr:enoyl-CoA hydratase/isomerase family protein [Paracoccaceae bacterium]
MSDIEIRKAGRAGRITLNRPDVLNALTWDMCLAIEGALDAWAADDEVALVIIDGAGERAFCAGGDIAEMYRTGREGDFDYGRGFWADEYRMNAKVFEFPKPYVALMQGFTMGGGVGVSCHGSHRVVGTSSRIAMPECAIGLVPDVGGSMILSQAPGRMGEYLGTTGYRMGPSDAILAGFADYFVPEDSWPALIGTLEESGDVAEVDRAAKLAPPAPLKDMQAAIDRHFKGATLGDVMRSLDHDHDAFSATARKALLQGSPLAMACAYEMIGRVRGTRGIRRALEMEYRFTYRAGEQSDFLEGIRAAIIDKDRRPNWRHDGPEDVTVQEVAKMLMPLGADRLTFGD